MHKCEPEWVEENERISGYGTAIKTCYEIENGELWVDNSEYGSQVNFCPYCGYKAKIGVPNEKLSAAALNTD